MSDQKRIFVHIGTHKTGSTALQETFLANSNALSEAGLVFLKNSPLFRELMESDTLSSDRVLALKKWIKCETEKYPRNNFLISAEALSGDVSQGYSNAPVIAASLAEAFSDFSCEIICYLRRQDAFVESLYTQLIHQGQILSFKEFCSEFPINNYNWFNLLSGYESAFG